MHTIAAALVLAALGAGGHAAALAQNAPGGFSLPEPTPTPTPAPQGPVDVRSGVPIAPRSIPDETPQPAASSLPDEAGPETQTAGEIEIVPDAAPIDPAARPASQSGQGTDAPQNAAQRAPDALERSAIDAAAPTPPASTPISPPTTSPASAPPTSPTAAPQFAPVPGVEPAQDSGLQPAGSSLWLWALVALGLAVAAAAGAFALRARKAGARQAASVQTHASEKAKPVTPPVSANAAAPSKLPPATPPAAPYAKPRIDLEFEIADATRSLMMFTLECRITIANRSDTALRDLAVAGSLVCAHRSATAPDAGHAGTVLETIERIAPNQSRTIAARLTLPLSEVQLLRQGQKPLFIPLAQIVLTAPEKGAEKSKYTRSFVIGTPSTASTGRLHPIALDTPPGNVPSLLARQVKADGAAAKAA